MCNEGGQDVGDDGGDVGHGHDPRRHHGGGSQEHDDRGGFCGRDQAVQHIARLQFAVDEHTHDHGVHHADHACLGSGKLTAAQTNQNEQGQQQRPQAIADGVQDLTLGLTGCGGQVVPLCNKEPDHAQSQRHVNSGSDTAHEQLCNRNTGLHAEDDHGNGRRHDGRKDVAGCNQTGAAVTVVARLDHHGDQNSTQRSGRGNGRTDHGGKQQDGNDGHIAQAAPDVTHQRVCKVDDALGDAAAVHELTCQHEEGNSHHGEGVCTGEQVHRQDHGVEAVQTEHHAHTAEQQRKADGQTDQDTADQGSKKN